MVTSDKPAANGFVRVMRKVYNPIGFAKGYNFILWFFFASSFLGFTLSRFTYLDVPNNFCGPAGASPGECYYYERINIPKIGIRLHLYMILPASVLAMFQFIPSIRQKVTIFHRINGYVVIVMCSISSIGCLMIARHALGGSMATQTVVGFLVIATTTGFTLAIYNVKQLQIDQHRAWMLRTWFYFGSIITTRLIMLACAFIISSIGSFYMALPCVQLSYIFNDNSTTLTDNYPVCSGFAAGSDPFAQAAIHANTAGNDAEFAAAFNLSFGNAMWLALIIHAIGVEIYLHLTPAETNRLRQVSYQRQLEAGYKRPGNAGLTHQRLGDSDDTEYRGLNITKPGDDDNRVSMITVESVQPRMSAEESINPHTYIITSQGRD